MNDRLSPQLITEGTHLLLKALQICRLHGPSVKPADPPASLVDELGALLQLEGGHRLRPHVQLAARGVEQCERLVVGRRSGVGGVGAVRGGAERGGVVLGVASCRSGVASAASGALAVQRGEQRPEGGEHGATVFLVYQQINI
ncbi:MAG: hypothetical protein SGPRY_002973 [Prymnesium sp.]